MATEEPSAQRRWRAACPHCGAPVEFRSAAAPAAVCSFCRSTLARDGETLRRIGESAELFDDHSPLQLGAAGRYQGAAFTVVGRLQLRYAQGVWNEWHALFDTGRSGWLSEDNGRYVIAFDVPLAGADVPEPRALQPGGRCLIDGRPWEVAWAVLARVQAAQGELPATPNLRDEFFIVDLRNAAGEVGTLDYADPARVVWSVGRAVELADLSLIGLVQESAATLGARSVQCPNCGAALEIRLQATQSIACHQCRAVVDVSQGVGADLAHYVQDNPRLDGGEPQIPLGTLGTLALGEKAPTLPWQVVGYAERCEIPSDADDEQVFWREYLLYNRTAGFAFLVDAEDGWSWTAPITGAPQGRGAAVVWRGRSYRRLYEYTGQTTYVAGEFYWKLSRGERTRNTDYASGRFRLNREETPGEVTWSAGETLEADAVADTFRVPAAKRAALRRDVGPLAGGGIARAGTIPVLWIFVAIVVMMVLMEQCSNDGCEDLRRTFGEASNEYQQCKRSGAGSTGFRTRGGSFGGFGTGGGHK